MGSSIFFWLDLNVFLAATVLGLALAVAALSMGPRRLANYLFAGAALVGSLSFFLSAVLRMLLRLEGVNRDFWLHVHSLLVTMTATLTFLFAAYYVQRASRWVNVIFGVGVVANFLIVWPLFQGKLMGNARIGPGGVMTYDITAWGYVLSLVPLLYCLGAVGLFWQGRWRVRDPFMAWAALLVVMGVCLGALLHPPLPLVSLIILAGLLLVTYGIIHRHILNPLKELTDNLENKVAERTRSLSETAARLEQANQELTRRSNEQAALLAALPDLVFRLSQDGIFLDYKASRPENLLFEPEKFLGRSLEEVLPPHVAALTQKALANALQTCETVAFEYQIHPDPQRHFYEARVARCGESQAIVIVRDITARRQAEESLHASERRLNSILETVPDAITIVAPDGGITYANPSAEKLLGLTRCQIMERTYNAPEWKITAPNGGPFPEREMPFVRVMATGQPVYGVEHAIEHSDGRRTILSINAAPLYAAAGQIEGMLAAMVDVTERKAFEQALSRHAGEMMALYDTSLAINSQPDLHSLLHTVVEHAAQLLDADAGGLYLTRPEEECIELVVSYYLPDDYTGYRLRYGEGVSGLVVQTGQMMMISDYQACDRRLPAFASANLRRLLCVPLKWKGNIIGVLNVADIDHVGTFTEEQIRLASMFADQAAVAVANAQLFEEARRHAEQLEMLNRIGLAITSGLDMDKVLRTIHEQCSQVAPVDCFYVALYDAETADLHIPFFYDSGEYSTRPTINLEQQPSITGYVIQTRRTLYFPDTLDPQCHIPVPLSRSGGTPSRSYAASPLLLRDRVIGVISMQSYQPNAYTPKHLRLFETIATQAAIAVENARLYVQVQRLAIVDELTGVYNYRGLMEMGPREVERSQRFNRPLSALFFDIDHFRDFNNRYSHATGNLVLRAVADHTRTLVRSVDFVSRYGGEEFVVLLPEAGLPIAREVAERLRRGIEQMRLLTEWGSLGVTISVGVAQLGPNMSNLAALLDRADYAEHLAKERGRNCVVITE